MAANKLTPNEIDEIKYFYRLGATQKTLAEQYGLSKGAIYNHTVNYEKRKAYRHHYYLNESISAKIYRKNWEQSEKGKRCKFNTHLKSWYGITIEQYEEKLKEQNFACAICLRSQDLFKKRLHVDHDHATEKVRGLLCTDCNTRLETLENINFRFKASAYLQKFKIGD